MSSSTGGAEAVIRLSNGDVALFASDMHLGDHDPATAAWFLLALEDAWRAAAHGQATHGQAAHGHATHVFLLGDLFEAWVGDDQPDAAARDAQALFSRMTSGGCRLFAMRGNRDFLLDLPARQFSARTGVVMLDDPCRLILFGAPVALAHGDALCTDDVDYQRLRAQVRSPAWQRQFLARPLPERLAMARALRAESERARARRESGMRGVAGGMSPTGNSMNETAVDDANPVNETAVDDVTPRSIEDGRQPAIDDLNPSAVDDLLRHVAAFSMIHGHTHRCACHTWSLDGSKAQRWVLPDWDAASGRGGFLRVDAAGFRWQPPAPQPQGAHPTRRMEPSPRG